MGYIRGDILDKPPGRSNDQLRMCIRSSYHSYGFTQDEQLIRNWWFRGTKRYFWLFWVVLVTVSTDLKLKSTWEPFKIFIWSSYGLHMVFSWQLKGSIKRYTLKVFLNELKLKFSTCIMKTSSKQKMDIIKFSKISHKIL